jgi:hypothetical protein
LNLKERRQGEIGFLSTRFMDFYSLSNFTENAPDWKRRIFREVRLESHTEPNKRDHFFCGRIFLKLILEKDAEDVN